MYTRTPRNSEITGVPSWRAGNLGTSVLCTAATAAATYYVDERWRTDYMDKTRPRYWINKMSGEFNDDVNKAAGSVESMTTSCLTGYVHKYILSSCRIYEYLKLDRSQNVHN